MYLSVLKEKEKERFLELAYALSSADGNFSEEEKDMIGQYCVEMGIENVVPSDFDREKVIDDIRKESKIKIKKILIFELVGLAMADNKYNDSEKCFIEYASSKFDLPDDYVEKCKGLISDYFVLQNKINGLVLN